MRYAAGKRAWGICDRSGLRYPLRELVPQIVNGVKTGLLVAKEHLDEDHPQNFIGRTDTSDAQSLKNPRPDTSPGRDINYTHKKFGALSPALGLRAGTVGIITSNVDVYPSGVSMSAGVGSVTPFDTQVVPISGQAVSTSVGTSAQSSSISVALSGLALSGTTGASQPASSVSVTLSGLGMAGSVGSASAGVSIEVPVTGVSASVSQGTPAAGEVITYSKSSITGGGKVAHMINGSYINGVNGLQGPPLTMVRGNTYRFVHVSAAIYNIVRIFFSTTEDGIHNSGVEYTDGVVLDPTGFTVSITVAADAPDTLYYYGTSYTYMGNTITVTD